MNAPPTWRQLPWKRIGTVLSVAVIVAWLTGFAVGLLVRLLL